MRARAALANIPSFVSIEYSNSGAFLRLRTSSRAWLFRTDRLTFFVSKRTQIGTRASWIAKYWYVIRFLFASWRWHVSWYLVLRRLERTTQFRSWFDADES